MSGAKRSYLFVSLIGAMLASAMGFGSKAAPEAGSAGLKGGAATYHFDIWTTDNGLPQNSVTSILQTHDGFLWLTTYDGLVRYDGVQFRIFNAANAPGL